MVKATIVYFDNYAEDNFLVFRTTKGFPLIVKSCNHDSVTLCTPFGTSIRYFADVIEGCFHEKSNFTEELSEFFNLKKLNKIKFVFYGIDMTITKENSNKINYIWQNSFNIKTVEPKIAQAI